MTTVPASLGSELVEVPRQTAFVTRNVFPPTVHVRVCIRVWVAVKAAETSDVHGWGCVAAAAPTSTKRPTATRRATCLGRRMPITPPFMVLQEGRSPPTVKTSGAARKDFVRKLLQQAG